MKNTTLKILMLVAALFATGLLLAGSLNPPGPPAPTMVTLQQIYDKLGAPADVARTGQTGCWNAAGALITCAGTGQDGALVKGVSVSSRFTDNGASGTVTDNLTGLTWLRNANCLGLRTWAQALSDANALASGSCGLQDGSTVGTWRLPNSKELQSLIDFGTANPAFPVGHPFTGVVSDGYWTSTTFVPTPTLAWYVDLAAGGLNGSTKGNGRYVWPVRGGQ